VQDRPRATSALSRQRQCLMSKEKDLQLCSKSLNRDISWSQGCRTVPRIVHRRRNSCRRIGCTCPWNKTAHTDRPIANENDQCLQTSACSIPGTLELNRTGAWTPEMPSWTSVSLNSAITGSVITVCRPGSAQTRCVSSQPHSDQLTL